MFPNLKLQIWRTGLRQNRVAQMVNIDETMLSKILNGFREPSIELQGKLASLLECDAAWLFERQESSREVVRKQSEPSDHPNNQIYLSSADSPSK